MYYENSPATYNNVLTVIDTILIYLFSCEMVLKIFALGPAVYFHDPWNKFDCVIVISSWLY